MDSIEAIQLRHQERIENVHEETDQRLVQSVPLARKSSANIVSDYNPGLSPAPPFFESFVGWATRRERLGRKIGPRACLRHAQRLPVRCTQTGGRQVGEPPTLPTSSAITIIGCGQRSP